MKNALLLLAVVAVLATVAAPAAHAETNIKSALSPCILFGAIPFVQPIFDCGPNAGPVVQDADSGRVTRTKDHNSGRVDASAETKADSGSAARGGQFESPYDEEPWQSPYDDEPKSGSAGG